MPDRNIFSLTPILDYLECPVLYKWRYVHSIPHKEDRGMAVGERVHKYIETISRILWESGTVNRKVATLRADEDIKPYIETFLHSRLVSIPEEKPEKMYLERLFYFNLGESFITGKLDRVDISPGSARIYDYKTSRKGSTPLSERYRMQLAAYMAAVSQITGIPVAAINGSISYLGDGAEDTVTGDEGLINEYIRILAEAIYKIREEKFDPVKDTDCKKYCHYHNLCK